MKLMNNEVAKLMNIEKLMKKIAKAIFNHNYSSFIINYSFYKWHPDYTVFIKYDIQGLKISS